VIDVACLNLIGPASLLSENDNILWMGVLQSLNGYQMYRQQIQARIQGTEVVDFLLKDQSFPRSVNYCLGELSSSFKHLPRHDPAIKTVRRARRVIARVAAVDLLADEKLHEFIDQTQENIGRTHESLTSIWFNG